MFVSVIYYSVTVILNHITACCAHSKHTATKELTDAPINLTRWHTGGYWSIRTVQENKTFRRSQLLEVVDYLQTTKQCLRDRLCLGFHAKGTGKAPTLSALLDGASLNVVFQSFSVFKTCLKTKVQTLNGAKCDISSTQPWINYIQPYT